MDFYNERLIKKPHKEYMCEGCRKKMNVNRKHWYISAVWNGDFSTVRLCFACNKHLEKFSKDYQDGWGLGDLREGRIKHVHSRKYKHE